MKKSTLAITLGAIAVAAAALVPFKVEKEDPEEGSKTTKVKLRALSYALDVSVTPDESVDVSFRTPGISKFNLVNVEKHIELKKPEDELNVAECDFDCDSCENPCEEFLTEEEALCDNDCENCETPCEDASLPEESANTEQSAE